jgi:RHS repeat-associated protein
VDENEKPILIQSSNTLPSEFSYDNLGRLKNISQGDRVTRFNYDPNGYLSEVIDPENRSTQFANDILGQVTKTITPDNEETQFTFDKNSNLSGIKPPQKLLHQFLSNAVDLISSYIAPSATGEQYSYDGDNRIQIITYESGFQTVFGYQNTNNVETSGQLARIYSDFNFIQSRKTFNAVTTENKEIRTTNDSYIQIVTSKWAGDLLIAYGHNNNQNGASFGINYNYNQQLQLTSETTGFGTFNYAHDNDGLPIQFGALSVNRDTSTGRITEKILGNLKEIISYNQYGEISERNYTKNNSSIYKETYARDKLGRIITKTIFKNGSSNIHSYEYDQRGRLHKTYLHMQLKNTYTYDANGNRLTKISSSGDNYSAQYDQQDRITQFTLNNETTTFTRQNDDTQITQAKPGESTIYQLSRLSPLIAVHKFLPDTSFTRSYNYDADLRRNFRYYLNTATGNLVRLHTHYDERGRLRATIDFANSIRTSYVYLSQSHSPDYMVRDVAGNETTYFIIKDQIGSILQLVDQSGNVAQDIEYDEFGNMTLNSNPEFQPLGFAAGLYDPDTKLTRFGVRDYDPSIGRWLQRDPIKFEGGTTNLYEYVSNDPINYIDPTGLEQDQLCRTGFTVGGGLIGGTIGKSPAGTLIGACVGVVVGGIVCPDNPDKPDDDKK